MTSSRAGHPPASAREAAFAVLNRAEAADAFVSILLFRLLDRSGLPAADRALATAITLGVLRHRARLDHALAPHLRRPLASLPSAIRTILRMGAYQILDMDRIPAPVATSEAVTQARRHGHPGTARLVNAVLRHLVSDGAPPPPDRATDPLGYLAVIYSHPRWLLARWAGRWGMEEAAALAEANTTPAPSVLRANTLRITAGALLEALRERGVEAAPGSVLDAIRVRGSLVARLPLIDQGLCVVQDEGSILVSHAVAPPAGGTVIDACAGIGNKATHLAALLGGAGRVVACDIHPRKLHVLAARAAALGVTNLEAHHLDAAMIGRRWPGQADAVLVDAPCSGLGTLRRRPEIKWRVTEDAPTRHAQTQRAILDGAAPAVRRGGVLLYSVCSLEPEEGPQVVEAFLAARPDFERTPLPQAFPGAIAGAPIEGRTPGEAVLLPHRHDTDGFYLARLRRHRGH